MLSCTMLLRALAETESAARRGSAAGVHAASKRSEDLVYRRNIAVSSLSIMKTKTVFAISLLLLLALTFAVAEDAPAAAPASAPAPEVGATVETADAEADGSASDVDEDDEEEASDDEEESADDDECVFFFTLFFSIFFRTPLDAALDFSNHNNVVFLKFSPFLPNFCIALLSATLFLFHLQLFSTFFHLQLCFCFTFSASDTMTQAALKRTSRLGSTTWTRTRTSTSPSRSTEPISSTTKWKAAALYVASPCRGVLAHTDRLFGSPTSLKPSCKILSSF